MSEQETAAVSRELQCVGKLEITRPKPVGFLCGSIPVPTDNSFRSHSFNSSASAIIPSTVSAPRYRILPTETDLNSPPVVNNFPDKVLPIGAAPYVKASAALEGGAVTSNLSREGEALAVSGLVEYGDEIDVIAPADILKQIFKIPYSKARLSIAVRRVGQTLILNSGPDVEEGEKLARRHSPSKSADQSLFLNFAMHSVRMEACDCPPGHNVPPEEQPNSSVLPRRDTSQLAEKSVDDHKDRLSYDSEYRRVKRDGFFWNKKNKKSNSQDSGKTSAVDEVPSCSMQESEKHRRIGNNGFLRVLYWQFHNFRMLLGSDLLLFSNEKYVAISLHLWDVTRQVTPLTWLEAWLDNVMASVPELAICYHQNGVVQGYELLKTDDIFLLKGVSEDGTPAFNPHVVQQNGLSVLRFLQENCEQDPGAYWLYKSAGEDVIQLFDLSIIPSNHSSDGCDENSSSLPSLMHRGRSDSMFSLGILLYRVAHRLSLSVAPNNRARCAMFIKKCLDFLNEPDHLVVRAYAHEQFARLMLNYDKELDICECFPVECEVTVGAGEEDNLDFLSTVSEPLTHENTLSTVVKDEPTEDGEGIEDLASQNSVKMYLEASVSVPRKLIGASDMDSKATAEAVPSSSANENSAVCKASSTSTHEVQTVADPISSKLTAIHHVSQAIKSLRLMRQLRSSQPEVESRGMKISDKSHSSINCSVCACGDADCIEVCDIRQWLPTSKLDNRLWKLVLLLGESYLALGQAYKEACELHQALKVVELACSVYGSMPQHLEDAKFVSSMTLCLSSQSSVSSSVDHSQKETPCMGKQEHSDDNLPLASLTYLFWAKAWTLVGDVYVEFHIVKGKDIIMKEDNIPRPRGPRVSSEVVKEVKRLRKKLGQYVQNCSSCSLVNCSCQSDRASSNSSASSSGKTHPTTYGRKQGKRSHAKGSNSYSRQRDYEYNQFHQEANSTISSNGHLQQIDLPSSQNSHKMVDKLSLNSVAESESKRVEDIKSMQNVESLANSEIWVASEETQKTENGGIFKYLGGPVVGNSEHNLLAALYCYDEAIKTFDGLPLHLQELQSVLKKKGWVCNELGRFRLELKEIKKAELAFEDAINAFREVSDHVNIILISCNMGHGRRALAEEMVSKIEEVKGHKLLHNAYNQALEAAKCEYSESLRYYGVAKLELNSIALGADLVLNNLRNEVYTQLAHTYLRLGMLLAKEDSAAEVYDKGVVEDIAVCSATRIGKTRNEQRKHEISANDAIREALSLYGSLGELRRQEAAYAYFQLASYQRDCCLKFLESDKKNNISKCESSILQRGRQYASLAEKNWQKAAEFYGPKTHPIMYLNIQFERSALLTGLSDSLHSHAMLESAISRILEGRHVSEVSIRTKDPELHSKYWSQLQLLFKKMLVGPLSTCTGKSLPTSQATFVMNRSTDAGKLKELYRMSLRGTGFNDLHAIHTLWMS